MAAKNDPQYARSYATDKKRSPVPSSQSTWLAQGLDRTRTSPIIYFDGDDAPATFGGFAEELQESLDSYYVEQEERKQKAYQSGARTMGDVRVTEATIWPQCLEEGVWPDGFDLSDHGMVTVTFKGKCLSLAK